MSSTRGTMQPILHFDSEKVGTVKLTPRASVFNLALSGQGFRQDLKGELINTTVYPPLYMIFTQFPSSVWSWTMEICELVVKRFHKVKYYL